VTAGLASAEVCLEAWAPAGFDVGRTWIRRTWFPTSLAPCPGGLALNPGWSGERWRGPASLEPYVLERPTDYAGTDRGSGTADNSLGNSWPVFGAELLCAKYYGLCRSVESLGEGPAASRGVVGTSGNSGGNRDWRCSDGNNVRPEVIRLLHL